MISEAEELFTTGKKLDIKIELLTDSKAEKYINKSLNLFSPFKVTGHLGIGHNSIDLPIDKWEFSYMEHLDKEGGYIFFDQMKSMYKHTVVKIEDIRLLGKILENSFGMEYFLTNEKTDFLIAVNWYVIEVAGTAKKRLGKLLVDTGMT